MTTSHVPHNDDLARLESETEDELVTPEVKIFDKILHPEPTDEIRFDARPSARD